MPQNQRLRTTSPKPFFPYNPLEDFEPPKPDFDPEVDPDYDEEYCTNCGLDYQTHSNIGLVKCALTIIRGESKKE